MDAESIVELGEFLFGEDNKHKMLSTGVMLRCPFAPYDPAHKHKVDVHPGFKVKVEEYGQSVCHCFTCKNGGTLLSTMHRLNEVSGGEFDDALEFVKECEDASPGVMLDHMEKREAAKKLHQKKKPVEVQLYQLIKKCEKQEHPYLIEERGLHPHELVHWHLGYDKDRKRITFPVFDQEGNPVAVYGRRLGEHGVKYLLYDKISASIDGYFFGEQFLDLTWGEPIILVEGPLDAIVLSRYFRNVLSCLGTNLTKTRVQKLKAWRAPVVFLFDSDAAGRQSAKIGAKAISRWVRPLHIAKLPAGKDPAECDQAELQKALEEKLLFMDILS